MDGPVGMNAEDVNILNNRRYSAIVDNRGITIPESKSDEVEDKGSARDGGVYVPPNQLNNDKRKSMYAQSTKIHDSSKPQRAASLPPQAPAHVQADFATPALPPVIESDHVLNGGDNDPMEPFIREGGPKTMSQDIVEQLKNEGYSNGLAKALAENTMAFNHKIWVIDNSGSMLIGDGHRIAESTRKEGFKTVASTRWEEIQDTVKYHAEMAALLDTPTIFKLLNDPGTRVGPQEFRIGDKGEAEIQNDIETATKTMKRVKPGGVTPLTRHIWEIQQSIQETAPQLVANGQKVVIVLATDGLPTDEQGYGGECITDEFVRALKSLEGLPVWLVVRLCTDEEPVTRFYNNLDGQLEFSLEVLDDFIGEAREVYRHNKWLNYGLPMHRCREMGYHDRIFDLIDERPLTRGEVRQFCALIFGVDDLDELPDPAADWKGFIQKVDFFVKQEKLQWNPIRKRLLPWINTRQLNRTYGGGGKCTIM
mmetsp:Transcript_13118/g.19088  ORF Transcript_13118/g.19088 Transcript_13118/m.19088 type:complete len:480 (-) Transcript_13118:777-2216(-)